MQVSKDKIFLPMFKSFRIICFEVNIIRNISRMGRCIKFSSNLFFILLRRNFTNEGTLLGSIYYQIYSCIKQFTTMPPY
jgi:hypothetical protein